MASARQGVASLGVTRGELPTLCLKSQGEKASVFFQGPRSWLLRSPMMIQYLSCDFEDATSAERASWRSSEVPAGPSKKSKMALICSYTREARREVV